MFFIIEGRAGRIRITYKHSIIDVKIIFGTYREAAGESLHQVGIEVKVFNNNGSW